MLGVCMYAVWTHGRLPFSLSAYGVDAAREHEAVVLRRGEPYLELIDDHSLRHLLVQCLHHDMSKRLTIGKVQRCTCRAAWY